HAVLRREGLHHDPRRLCPPGPQPAPLHLPAGRLGQRAVAGRPQLARERGGRHRRAQRPGRRPGARDRGGGRRGAARRTGVDDVHGHRPVPPRAARPAAAMDGQPPGAGPARPRGGRLRRAGPGRLGRQRRRGEGAPLMGLLLAAVAGYGVFLVYTAVVFGWTGAGLGPAVAARRFTPLRRERSGRDWLRQAGLDGVSPRQLGAVMAVLFATGAAVAFALFGGVLPAVAAGVFAATFP